MTLRYKIVFSALIGYVLFVAGCTNHITDSPLPIQPPKTYIWLWVAPDSTIAPGASTQQFHWWGSDQNGAVEGFLITSGKLPSVVKQGIFPDSLRWTWTAENETTLAFPLLKLRDTFMVAVRAVNNTFHIPESLSQGAQIRFVTGGIPFWDKKGNGIFGYPDVHLPTLAGATDPKGAALTVPLVNSPPTIAFAGAANNPGVTMVQPETTFTVATFAWVGSSPQGDSTIARYEIVLNDTSDHSGIFTVSASGTLISMNGNTENLITLVVPRDSSNSAVPGQEVSAQVWSGTFGSHRANLGSIPHLKLDANNFFWVRARDTAGAYSPYIRMPDTSRHWYVKKPMGNVLIVDDYIAADQNAALAFYESSLTQAGFPNYDVLNIGEGLDADEKNDGQYGALVPSYLDPAFVSTLHLYDVVVWYTDPYPSLTVAGYPLYQYTHDPSQHGKVIFSTSFQTVSNPTGDLVDFAPLDSVSTVSLSNNGLVPTEGALSIPGGYLLSPDSAVVSANFPTLKFNAGFQSVYMRPIYALPNASYLYSIQPDARSAIRYTSLATLNSLNSIFSTDGATIWACGTNGAIVNSSDSGTTWGHQTISTGNQLNKITFRDKSDGWIVGDAGTILQTSDGGSTWNAQPIFTFESLKDIEFVSLSQTGFICSTTGYIMRSTNNGSTWKFLTTHTAATLYAVRFAAPNLGIAVGDSGTVVRTDNGGDSCRNIPKVTSEPLRAVWFIDTLHVIAAGGGGIIIASSNGGKSWLVQTSVADVNGNNPNLQSLYFTDSQHGWTCGTNGEVYFTADGGSTWNEGRTGIEENNNSAQTLNSLWFSSTTQGLIAGTGGVVFRTTNSGSNWTLVPPSEIRVAAVDGIGIDGYHSIVFFGLPLHIINGTPSAMQTFFKTVLHTEFGL